jgi:hypothetical protein
MGDVEQSESAGKAAFFQHCTIPVTGRCRNPRQNAVAESVSKNAVCAFGVLHDDGIAKMFGESHRHLSHIALLFKLHSAACTDKNVRAGTAAGVRPEDHSTFENAFVLHANNIGLPRRSVKELQ